MPLLKRRLPFNHPDWLLKYDGFRAVARIRSGRCQLISRNGNPFASFSDAADGLYWLWARRAPRVVALAALSVLSGLWIVSPLERVVAASWLFRHG